MCDGIFLNYNWTETGLSSSRALARERKGEVYVGIDVFGRGCPGGGGFNSCQVRAEAVVWMYTGTSLIPKSDFSVSVSVVLTLVSPCLQALKSIHQCGLSSALFAPGWVFELQDKARFFPSQNK